MKALFYIISLFPKPFFVNLLDIYLYTRIYRLFSSFKITKVNLQIAYPELNQKDIHLLSKLSIKESIISGYETIYTWGRQDYETNSKIFRIENNFLLNKLYKKNNGLIAVAIHNRSVDMLLKWINSKTNTTTLYKKVKIKYLDKFVRKQREENNNEVYETNINGVRKIFKAFIDNKVVCLAADQVPKRGMGEYIKFFNTDAYTTTLAASMVYKTKKPAVFICMNSFENNRLGITIYPSNESIYNDSEYKLSINQSIENLIKINPKDYSWEYKRFRRSPSGIDPYVGI